MDVSHQLVELAAAVGVRPSASYRDPICGSDAVSRDVHLVGVPDVDTLYKFISGRGLRPFRASYGSVMRSANAFSSVRYQDAVVL